MNSEPIYFTFDTDQPKLSAPLSTKVPEQTDWEIYDFHQTVTDGHHFENWYTPSYNTCNSRNEALLDILSLIEQKQNRHQECWHSDQESTCSLPELDEDQSDDESSESIETNSTLVLSRTTTIVSDKPTKQFKIPRKVSSIMLPFKHLFSKRQNTRTSAAPVASIFSKYFMK